ncbi:MAG TPA: sulfite exporter TauE/SafE family protein [Candidatus Saccharimonadales bacterium]|nr:sulfite exporter TauE/SafE family protein [Candidatus Saccharimonadales bacterium]
MTNDLILFLIGIFVGSMNAIAGGGMLLGFPAIIAFGHVSALVANATANVAILPGGVSSAYGYKNQLKKVPRKYFLLLIPALAGSAVGAVLLRETKANNFASLVPWLLIIAVALFAFQPILYKRLKSHISGKKKGNDTKPLLIISLGLVPLSIYGGYFGAGFGFVMLAFLGFTGLHNYIHRMNAVKNLVSVAIALADIVLLYSSHLINWRIGVFTALGSAVGGYLGSTYIQKVSSHSLRIVVIVIGVGSALFLGIKN